MQKQTNGTKSPESVRMNNATQDKLSLHIPANTTENSMEFLQRIKNRATILSNNSISVYISKGNENSISKSYL